MTRFTDHLMPLTACPYCAKVLDMARAVGDDTSRPVGGDATLCIDCGEWCIFNDNLTLRKPSDDELLEISHEPVFIIARKAWNGLQAAINEGAV